MSMRTLFAAGSIAAALAGFAGAADAAALAKPAAKHDCFFSSQWQGWRAPDDNTLYLRVGVRDIYRVDLVAGSSRLTWPNTRLINIVRGASTICSPLDLDLRVSDGFSSTPVIAKSLTKLTPEQVAQIPKKDLP